jgi:TolB-like protein/Flp pilus assembly protein TadD
VAEGDGEEQATGAHSATHDVFISYASPDSTVAETACKALEQTGMTCWMAPRDVTPGASYAGQIIHAIDAAKAIVLILSQHAASSPHVLREVERAASKRHPIVSLRIDQAPLPADFEYFLNTSHWLDGSAGDTGRVLPKLIAAVQIAIHAPATTPVGASAAHSPAPSASARSPNRTAIVVASLVGLVLAGFAADRLWLSNRRAASTPASTKLPTASAPVPAAPTNPEKSIAVLPFTDMSEKKDQEYFADGMAEEILDLLVQIPELTVIGRTSSFQFKGRNEDLRTIGERLNAAYVLEGSVRKSGNRIRVTTQLIDTRTGAHQWSQTYDRDIGDVLKLQDEIAADVCQSLRIALSDPLPARASSKSSEAYRMYLEGRFYGRGPTKADSDRAISAYRNALALDPNYAPAWAALARELASQADYFGKDAKTMYAAARDAAQRAIDLDPRAVDGYLSMFYVNQDYDWDWTSARRVAEHAQQLQPDNSQALVELASSAYAQGLWDTAISFSRQAVARDPLSLNEHILLANSLYCAGNLDEAVAEYRKLLQLDPRRGYVQALLGRALMQQGRLSEAATIATEDPTPEARFWALAMIYHAMGRRTEADAILTEFKRQFPTGYEDRIGWVYATWGDLNNAFTWFDRAYERRDAWLIWIKCMPEAPKLARDPRYKALLRKMNLPE